MMNRPTKDEYFMRMARLVATRSTCLRRSVGCVLVNERGHVIATGYNGVAAGMPHCNDGTRAEFDAAPQRDTALADLLKQGIFARDGKRGHDDDGPPALMVYRHACSGFSAKSGESLDTCEAIHAEQNALLQCRDVWSIDTCYTTTAPCIHCTKLLLNTSCHHIVYTNDYASDGLALWNKAGNSAKRLSTF